MFNYGLIPFAKVQLTYEKSSVEEKNKNKKIKKRNKKNEERKEFVIIHIYFVSCASFHG